MLLTLGDDSQPHVHALAVQPAIFRGPLPGLVPPLPRDGMAHARTLSRARTTSLPPGTIHPPFSA